MLLMNLWERLITIPEEGGKRMKKQAEEAAVMSGKDSVSKDTGRELTREEMEKVSGGTGEAIICPTCGQPMAGAGNGGFECTWCLILKRGDIPQPSPEPVPDLDPQLAPL